MITSFSSPKTKIPLSTNTNESNYANTSNNINSNKYKSYKDAANLLSYKNTNNKNNKINIKSQNENENINPNETLSNIIDAINENNLNTFYEDDNSNFKRNIDQLNLKFYLETEKIIKSTNNNSEVCFNSNKLFLILFKQINLYISEIERLNAIILDSKRDPHSISKKLSVINRQKSDFEVKEQIIKTLKFSISSLEKQLSKTLNSENLLRQENKRLQEEKKLYLDFYLKYNNKENSIIKDNNNNSRILINYRYNNMKLNSSNSNNKINTSNKNISKYNNNNNKTVMTNSYNNSSKKDEKIKMLENGIINNSNSNIKNKVKENGSTKKNDIILISKHRRTYSAQNEEMINSLNKKIDKISQGVIKHTNSKTNRLTKQENKNPTKIINKNINSPKRDSGFTPVENYKNKNKIIQSVKDGMREKYLNRKKKTFMNNNSVTNKLELILNRDFEGSFMKYKTSLYGNSPQYQTTTNGIIKEEDNLNITNKLNNMDINHNLTSTSKSNYNNKNDSQIMISELDFMENLITEVRDYLIDNKTKVNEDKKNESKRKLKENKTFNNNIGSTHNGFKKN